MTFHLRIFENPIAYVLVGRLHSYIQNTEIVGSLGLKSFRWQVTRNGRAYELYCSVRDGIVAGSECGFSLSYDDRSSGLFAVSAAGMEKLDACDLGELRTDLAFAIGPRVPNFKRRALYYHYRLIEPNDLQGIDKLIIGDNEIEP